MAKPVPAHYPVPPVERGRERGRERKKTEKRKNSRHTSTRGERLQLGLKGNRS